MNSYNEKTINEPSTPPQNKLLLEFINYIIQSNPAFNRDLLNATESSKQLAFKSIMEKLKKEGIVTNENHSMASLSELILNSWYSFLCGLFTRIIRYCYSDSADTGALYFPE